MTTKFEVSEQFATRPTLRHVATTMLRTALSEEYPGLVIDPGLAWVVASGEQGQASGQPLVDSLFEHFIGQSTPKWTAIDHALELRRAGLSAQVLAVPMKELGAIIDRLALGLIDGFKQAIAEFWSQPGDPGTPGPTRWVWLAEAIRQNLALDASDSTLIDSRQKELFKAVAAQSRAASPQIQAGVVCVTLHPGAAGVDFPLPGLVIVEYGSNQPQVLVYRLSGAFEHYSPATWAARLRQDFLSAGPVQWGFYQPQGDVFEMLTQGILENQFTAMREFIPDPDTSIAALERYFEALTDVASLFVAPTAADGLTAAGLPDWLRDADDADRLAYSRLMAALAALQARTQGRAFNDELPPITDFAFRALRNKLLEDHPIAIDLPLNDITLVVDKVVAGISGAGGQLFMSGEVEKVRLSLVDFALGNLYGLPVGTVTLQRSSGQAVPGWLTVAYVKQLVQAVDIGGVYPQLLRTFLLTDAAEAGRRRLLFADQLRIQLPLKALEQKLRGQGGVSDSGCGLVSVLMKPGPAGGHAVVLRPLAFVARPDRHADTVGNMFVIGPQDTARGPHLLYQPFSATPLTEFSSWEALRAAVVAPGDLQQNILLWLNDTARPVYANGGFDEPHIHRFATGSEFEALERPQPAQVCSAAVAGDPLHALFAANALALVELAGRESVSNAESRWAYLKDGSWLLLEAVMPVLGGALGNSLWLLQLFASVGQIITLPADAEPGVRAAALADLLLNIAQAVLDQGFAQPVATRWRSSSSVDAVVESAGIDETLLPAVVPKLDLLAKPTELDFSWSGARGQLTAAQQARLSAFEVSAAPLLGQKSTSGTHTGLYPYQGRWYAWVDGRVYRVVVGEDGVVVVRDDDPTVYGAWVVRDKQGWRFDLRLRLRGGGPKQNARKLAQANAANALRINDGLEALKVRAAELQKKIRGYLDQLKTAQGPVRELFKDRYDSDLNMLLETVKERVTLGQELRPGDRPAEKEVAIELKDMARQICFFEALLLHDQQKMAAEDLTRMREVSGVDVIVPETSDTYFELFRKLAAVQAKGVRWSGTRESLWAQLREVPKVGGEYWRVEVLEVYGASHLSSLEWQSMHMFSTLELVFSRPEVMFSDDMKLLKELRNDNDLHAAIASHAELDRPNTYSASECIAVVESALKEYDKASDVASYIHSMDFAGAKGQYLDQFIAQINAIREAAVNRLTTLVRETADAAGSQQEYVPKMLRPGKRVIRTRGHRTLVGNVRRGSGGQTGDVVEVTDPSSHKVIQSWHQHSNGEWVEVVDAAPANAPAASNVALSELTEQARALLKRVEVSIHNAWQQSKRANEPQDMEDILVQKADKLTELACQMQLFSGHTTLVPEVATQLATDLRDLATSAARLSAQGREIRIAMIKAQPPTAGRISYLHQQQEINISSFGSRKNMSGPRRDDFLQEFAVRDREQHILWWAHFHYATEDAPADAFTAAHLKLPEQRFLGYKTLLRAAKANLEVLSIYRSSIGKDIARRLFLVLTP